MRGDAKSHMYMSEDRLVTQERTVEKVQAYMKQGYKNLSWEGVPARDRRLTESLTGIELCRKRTDGNGVASRSGPDGSAPSALGVIPSRAFLGRRPLSGITTAFDEPHQFIDASRIEPDVTPWVHSARSISRRLSYLALRPRGEGHPWGELHTVQPPRLKILRVSGD